MMPKAYSYIRFSSAEQRKGDSGRRQLERSQQYATEHNLELVSDAEYSFLDEGRSGFSGEHATADGELARFLGKIKDGSIPKGSFLLIESFDRLSREALNIALPRFIDILNSDVTVVTLMDGRVYTKDFNQIDLFYSIMLMGTAHEESAKKSDRIGASWKNKQRLAAEQLLPMSKIAPSWLVLENNQYNPLPERIAVVEEIFQLVANGYGANSICRILNEKQVPIFGSANRNKRGVWGISSPIPPHIDSDVVYIPKFIFKVSYTSSLQKLTYNCLYCLDLFCQDFGQFSCFVYNRHKHSRSPLNSGNKFRQRKH